MRYVDMRSLEMVQIELRNHSDSKQYREAVLAEYKPQEIFTYLLSNYVTVLEHVNQCQEDAQILADFLNRKVVLTRE